jgi:DNA-binding transcriptional ArsR family regulator
MFTGRPEIAGRPAGLGRSASLFAALGDRTRLEVVSRLCAGGPASIARLTEGTGVTRQAVTKHLRVLTQAGLARSSRRGRESVWEIEPGRLAEARRHLDAIAQQWDRALQRLKIFVEKQP